MEDFPFDDNLIYVIPSKVAKPIKVVFENENNKETKLDYSYVIEVDLSNDQDIQKCIETIEKLFDSNS
jgi:deoxyribodipyrimidine photolyase-like uncharacterized protein